MLHPHQRRYWRDVPLTGSTPPVKLKCRPGVQPAVIQGCQAAQKGHSEKVREKRTGLYVPARWGEDDGGW